MFEQDLNTYWKTVVSTIQDGIMIVDKEGTVVSVNQAMEDLAGYTSDDLVGNPCSILDCDLCLNPRNQDDDQHWCHLFEIGTLKRRRCTLTRKDGSVLEILKNASLLRNTRGQVIGAVETFTDITEIIWKEHQIEAFRRQLRAEDGFHGIMGISAPMKQVFDLIENVAQSDAPVIILGESGTGKELVAEAIHNIGPRKNRPFVKVNCAALNQSLLESELFGHVKGAFTGAVRSRTGRFEAAQGGDLFLDEIGDLPLVTQVKLLRVLEEKVIERVGDNRSIPVDVRIITATNRDLKALVDEKNFRDDLYFRINIIPISLPPLRDRINDIPILAQAFFEHIRLKSGKDIHGISEDAMAALLRYHWPGNVRELKGAFEYAFVACHGPLIQPHHFPPSIFDGPSPRAEMKRLALDPDEAKRTELIEALKKAGGNQSKAARILGVSRVTVWNRMKKFGIDLTRQVTK
jgi:two-component system, NtrC family, response regulator HydG